MTLFRGAGLKETGPRRRVLETLRSAAGPLTAQEVAAGAGTSVASTYRVLALLVELGMVAETADGTAAGGRDAATEGRSRRYVLCSAGGHHHHFVCRSCHGIRDVSSDVLERAIGRVAAELAAASGLHIEEHELTLRGLCQQCAACGTAGKAERDDGAH